MIAALLLLVPQSAAETAAEKAALHLETRVADPDLRLLALVRIGGRERRPALQALIGEIHATPPAGVRSAALQAAALAELDPRRYRPRIAHCVQLLLDSQAADGLWGPGSAVEDPRIPPPEGWDRKFVHEPPPPPPVRLAPRAQAAGAGDAVNASWAGFGLLAAKRAAVDFPVEVARRAADAWTADGLDPVDVAAWRPAFLRLAGDAQAESDRVATKACNRLRSAPAPATPRDWFRLRLAMCHSGRTGPDERGWHADGVAALLASQKPDGSWGDVEPTACALLFLPPALDRLPGPRPK